MTGDKPPTIEELVREELSEWETFTASDGNTSIRMKAPRSTEAVVRAIVSKARKAIYLEAADAIMASEHLRSLTDDHMGDIDMAACELRRLSQTFFLTQKEANRAPDQS
jgi:hypothetical protein